MNIMFVAMQAMQNSDAMVEPRSIVADLVDYLVLFLLPNTIVVLVTLYLPAMFLCLWLFYRRPERRRVLSLLIVALVVFGLMLIPAFTSCVSWMILDYFVGFMPPMDRLSQLPLPAWLFVRWCSLAWLWWVIFPLLSLSVIVRFKIKKL